MHLQKSYKVITLAQDDELVIFSPFSIHGTFKSLHDGGKGQAESDNVTTFA